MTPLYISAQPKRLLNGKMSKFNKRKTAAFISLSSTEGIGPVTLKRLIDAFGKNIDEIAGCAEESIAARAEITVSSSALIKKALSDLSGAYRELEKVNNKGYRVYCYGDDDYPFLLKHIHDPPPVIYSSGCLKISDYNSIAVVGTRKASDYGKTVAALIARRLALCSISVVSGAATGIDTEAHRAALKAGGRTIAVMGGGLNKPYPSSNKTLLEKISAAGAVLSEFPPDENPSPVNFPRRNRIISGLSHGVVVIEAAKRSGALITASFAAEQGRQVYAVPGSVFAEGSRGCLDLIKDGAVPVSGAEEIIEDIKGQLDSNKLKKACEQYESENLCETAVEILNFLSSRPSHVDIIKNKLKMDISFLASQLTSLELKGRIKKIDGDKYIKLTDE